jgi:hypothetical protein
MLTPTTFHKDTINGVLPINGRFTRITGANALISTIIPLVPDAYQEIVLLFVDGGASSLIGGGNILGLGAGYTAVALRPVTLFYDPTAKSWYLHAT